MATTVRPRVVVAAAALVTAAAIAGLGVQQTTAATVTGGQPTETAAGTTAGVVATPGVHSPLRTVVVGSPSRPLGIPCASPFSTEPLRQKTC